MATPDPTRKRRKRLTPKQRAVIAFATAHPDATLEEIGIACGMTPSDPGYGAGRVLRSKTVQERMRDIMDKRPALQDEALLIKLEEGLNSTETKFFAHEGIVRSKREVTDMPTRKQYLDLAVRLKGALKEQHEVSGPNGAPIPMSPVIPEILKLSKEDLIALAKATK